MKKRIQEYICIPDRPAVFLMIPESEKVATLETIQAIQDLFGKGGRNWIKNDYKSVKDGITKVCLVGAVQVANGKYENAARAAISFAVAKITDVDLKGERVKDLLSDGELVINYNDKEKTSWKDVLKVLNVARKLVKEA